MDLWLSNHLRLTSCSDEIPSPTAWCQECCCYCSASEHVPRGTTDECYWTERQKADETLVCRNRDWDRAPGPLDWAPCCYIRDHTLENEKFIFSAAPSRTTQEWEKVMEGTVSSGQSSWEVTEIPKSLQNIPLYYISLGLFRPVSVLNPKSRGFTIQDNSSTTFLENISAVTYQWRKECIGQ